MICKVCGREKKVPAQLFCRLWLTGEILCAACYWWAKSILEKIQGEEVL